MAENEPEPVDFLTDVVQRLERARVEYMITGSVAGYFYGLNRSTQDTDIVVKLPLALATRFVAAFKDGFYVDQAMVEDAIRHKLMFNVISLRGGGKFDMIPLKDEPSEREKFERRAAHDWHGRPIWVTTAPDLVLSKLDWARDSRSRRQFADVRAIMASGFVDEHDRYFQHWLGRLNLRDVLDACREERYDE